jgi:hypothetical protein
MFPDGTVIRDRATAEVHFTRSFSSLLLNRRITAVGPTGVYTCLIPDAGNVLRTINIGLYGADGGELYCMVNSTCYFL